MTRPGGIAPSDEIVASGQPLDFSFLKLQSVESKYCAQDIKKWIYETIL
jgi:hypothetical protein